MSADAIEADVDRNALRILFFTYSLKRDRAERQVGSYRANVVHGYVGAANNLALLARGTRCGTRVVWGVRASIMDFDRYSWLVGSIFRLSWLL